MIYWETKKYNFPHLSRIWFIMSYDIELMVSETTSIVYLKSRYFWTTTPDSVNRTQSNLVHLHLKHIIHLLPWNSLYLIWIIPRRTVKQYQNKLNVHENHREGILLCVYINHWSPKNKRCFVQSPLPMEETCITCVSIFCTLLCAQCKNNWW